MRNYDAYRLRSLDEDAEHIGQVQATSMIEALRAARLKFPAVPKDELNIDEAEDAEEPPVEVPQSSAEYRTISDGT